MAQGLSGQPDVTIKVPSDVYLAGFRGEFRTMGRWSRAKAFNKYNVDGNPKVLEGLQNWFTPFPQ